MRQKLIVGILGALVSLSLFGSPASATMRLRIEDVINNVGAVVTDTDGDGSIIFAGTVGSFTLNVTTGVSKPMIGGITDFGQIDLNSINVITSGTGTLRITLEDTGYVADPFAILHVVGTVGGTLNTSGLITIQSWANGDNLVPNLGPDQAVGAIGAIGATPAGSVAAWSTAFTSGQGAFSSTSTGTFDNGPVDTFSLFAQVSIAFTAPGSVSFDEHQSAVPEPASLLLLGAGVAGLGLVANRKKQRRDS